ncbi:MAG: hypothetical protein ABFD97_12320 [Syntrophobacter sp.]
MTRLSCPMRMLTVALTVCVLCGISGCIYSRVRGDAERPVNVDMEVMAQSAIEQHTMNSAGLFPAEAPVEAAAISEKFTSVLHAQLLRARPFREIRMIPRQAKSDAEALWYARNEGCDLIILPSILYLADGSGAMPTRLVARIRILDARTGMVFWDVKQIARSVPGPDLDFTWTTISGEPAKRFPELAEKLARDFTLYLVQPVRR